MNSVCCEFECEFELGTEWPELRAQSFDRSQALLPIGIAPVNIILRQAVKRGDDDLRLEIKAAKMRPDRLRHRADIDRLVGIRRDGTERGLWCIRSGLLRRG